ncbi:TIGR03751 family conjugal transfer lipoprotein [Vibrio metschnikovii]|nr:TIGR03751 family conjugal transfer lipoprotein [Vibrio metschnikovii]
MVRLCVLIAVLALSGCSTTVKEKSSIIPESEYSMKDIYDHQGRPNSHQEARFHPERNVMVRPATSEELSINAYGVNLVNERPEFRKLPNPTLYIYFAPKLTSDGRMPVPAWMSEFKMYDRDEYALPGEMSFGERK